MSFSDSNPHALRLVQRVKTAVIGLFTIGTLLGHAQAAQPQYVAAQGHIVPEGGVIAVAASHDGGTPIVGKLLVNVGDTVKAGDALARLTTQNTLLSAVTEARARAEAAAMRSESATQQVQVAQARVAAADTDVTLAQLGVAEALAAQEVAEKTLTEAIAQMQAQQTRLSDTWAENKRILDNDGPPAREAAQLRFEQKMLDLQKAELATSHAGTTVRLQAQVAQAKAAVETARQRVANAEAAQAIAKAEVHNAEANKVVTNFEYAAVSHAVTHAELLAQTGTLTAPIDGTVLQINARAGEAVSPEGLLLIADLSNLIAEAEIYINDLRYVTIGQRAKITGEAFEGEISGTVERIGQMVTLAEIFARDPASFTDQSVVKVRIRLNAAKDGGTLPSPLPINSRLLVRIERN